MGHAKGGETMRQVSFRHEVFICAAIFLVTGCQAAMSAQTGMQKPPPETYAVPLHFMWHDFGAACYNTLRCSIVYNNKEFVPYERDKPSGAPQPDYRDNWDTGYLLIRNFPPPAEVQWTSMDGTKHEAKVDMAAIFKDQLIWHEIPRSDMVDFFHGPVAGEPGIFVEVNDCTINVYMHMLIPTKTEQIPGNKNSDFRDDWLLVWTRTCQPEGTG